MIQPKYDPKESLERIKLMMNYDSSKTLNENKKYVSILTEQPDDGVLDNAPGYAAGLATPSLYGAGKRALGFGKDAAAKKAAEEVAKKAAAAAAKKAAAAAAKETGKKIVTKAGIGALPWLGSLLGLGAEAGAGAIAMGALPWVAGAAAVGGLGYWLYDSITNGLPTAEKVKKFFEGCSAQDKNLKSTKTDGEITAAAEKINKAIDEIGTDEDAIRTAFASMPTAADLCGLKEKYDFKYGNLYEDLDGDIDGSDWQTYVWAPMSVAIEKSTNDIKKAITQPENPAIPPVPPVPPVIADDNSGEEQIDGEQIDGETPDDILNQ
jgi:hypothetical protein